MTHLDFTFEHREHMIRRDAKQEGMEAGMKAGMISSLTVLLDGKGTVTDTLLKKLESMDEERLKELLVVAANVSSVE